MFCSVLLSFVAVRKTMSGLPVRPVNETMHSFGLETKRTHPIHLFGPNSDVLLRFGQFRYSARNHAGVAFNAPVRPVNETKHSFGPDTKRTHPIHLFGPNSDVLLRFGQFRYCARNHDGVAFNAPVRPVNETMHSFCPETKRTHPIHLFGPNSYVLLRFGQFRYCARNHDGVAFNAPVRPVNETMHSFGPEMKRTHPIHLFGPNSDVFLCFGHFRYCARNHVGVAFNVPVRPVNETMQSFGPEMKRTHPIHLFGLNSDVLLRFGQFRYCARNHAGVAFNAPVPPVSETMHSFGPEMKRTHPIHLFGPNSDVLLCFGQFRCCARNHAGVVFNAPVRPVNETMHSFSPETKRTHPIHLFGPNSDVLLRFGQFRYCARNHAGVAFNAPVRPLTKRCTVSVQKRNERTQSTILDPIVMFGSVLVSFITVRETMPGLHLMHRCGPLTKRCTVSVQKRNERTQSTFLDPIVMFCSVLVSFVTLRETMPGCI